LLSFTFWAKATGVRVTSAGLCPDIAGALIVFRYGLPEEIDRSGHDYLVTEVDDASAIALGKKYDQL
jgi:hypothetical protein